MKRRLPIGILDFVSIREDEYCYTDKTARIHQSEVKTASGRIDTLVEIGKYVYCFTFKLDGTEDQALRQIDTRDYLLPWHGKGKTLVKFGVSFDSEKRNIGSWTIATEVSV